MTHALDADSVLHRPRLPVGLVLFALAVVIVTFAALTIGAMHIPLATIVAAIGEKLYLSAPTVDATTRAILFDVRAPRVLLGLGVGASLAVAGAVLQGLFRNPLADPTLVGTANGAAVGATAAIVLGPSLLPHWSMALGTGLPQLAAFLGALVASLVNWRLATRDGSTATATLLLAGVAIAAISSAISGVLLYGSDDRQLRDIVFWTLGSLAGTSWSSLLPAVPALLLPLVLLPVLARDLDAISLGEREARHLGIAVERTKLLAVALVALGVGAAVALAGIIAFVGLIVPHLVRLLLGPGHRLLLPGAALLGASLLVLADLIARVVVAPAELPIGLVTGAIGGPFFLWRLLRTRPC